MIVARVAGLAAPLWLAGAVVLGASSAMAQSADTVSPAASSVAKETDGSIAVAAGPQVRNGGGNARSHAGPRGGAPGGRLVAPRSSGMARSRPGDIRMPQKYVAPRVPRIQQMPRRAPSRTVVPARPPTREVAPRTMPRGLRTLPRVPLQATRKAPGSPGLVNRGWRDNPGRSKPAAVAHNPSFKAGNAGRRHRHRPFYFKHDGHRWRRHYYTYLVGGLWYWYWYDVIADANAAALVYPEAVLPACDLDEDDCVEPDLIAPALLEGRATQEAIGRCAAEFASFNPETGTYVGGDGEAEVCPYLR
jgi:hypothetical protein